MESDLLTGATELINKQIVIVRQLQASIIEALNRNDSGTAQRLIESCDRAFGTFTMGIDKMAIDVSNLKNVLKNGGANTDVIQQLSDRLTQIEQKVAQLDPTTITTLQTDVTDIKTALQELNSSAVSVPTTSV